MISKAKEEYIARAACERLQVRDDCRNEIVLLSQRGFCSRKILYEIQNKEHEFDRSELAQDLERKKSAIKTLHENRDASRKLITDKIKELTEILEEQDRCFKEQLGAIECEMRKLESCIQKTVTQPIHHLQRELERVKATKKFDISRVDGKEALLKRINRRLAFWFLFDKAVNLASVRKSHAKDEVLQKYEAAFNEALNDLVSRYPFSIKRIISGYFWIIQGDGFELLLKRAHSLGLYKTNRNLDARAMGTLADILLDAKLIKDSQ